MDQARYDVYLSGQLGEGVSPAAAAASLAQLFKSTPEAMAGLLTGRPQLLKRAVDKATALKYRDALRRAGVLVAFRSLQAAAGATGAVSDSAPSDAPTAAPDAFGLAPVGSELLHPEERPAPAAVSVDISRYRVEAPGVLPAPAAPPPPPAPATEHLSLAPTGADLLADRAQPLLAVAMPDIEAISLAPAGALLETLDTAPPAVAPDISHLSLAPTGSDLLDPEGRGGAAPPPPVTDHLQLL
jgi:hypothetical protein